MQVNVLAGWGFDYAYDANAHLSSQTYPGSVLVGYAPDALGRPTQAGTFASGVTYYPNGAMSGFSYGNGIVHTMTQNRRLLPSRSVDANGATAILDDTYTYDPNGNVLSLTDASNAPTTDNRTWGVLAATTYDGLDRLLSVRSTNQWGTATYTYDPLDNLMSSRLVAGVTSGYDYTYNRTSNLLTSLARVGGGTYAYSTNPSGDITADGRQAYQFDAVHRMSAVTGKESYLYDGNGRRARTLNSTTGTIEYFGYGLDGRLLQDWSNRRGVRNAYVYLGNTLVGLYEVNITTGATASRYKHTDALGSPVVTTDLYKVVLNRSAYTPYGVPVAPVDGVGYTGHFNDVGTGLTYMQQRYYDPLIGRFISQDPAKSEFNRYSYASNNPYRFTDPDGRVALGTGSAVNRSGSNGGMGFTMASQSAMGATGDFSVGPADPNVLGAVSVESGRNLDRTFTLSNPSKNGGFVVQQMNIFQEVFDNKGNFRPSGVSFFELFYIAAGRTSSMPFQDTFRAAGPSKSTPHAHVRWFGKAVFIEGFKPGKEFQPGNVPEAHGGKSAYSKDVVNFDWQQGTNIVPVDFPISW